MEARHRVGQRRVWLLRDVAAEEGVDTEEGVSTGKGMADVGVATEEGVAIEGCSC